MHPRGAKTFTEKVLDILTNPCYYEKCTYCNDERLIVDLKHLGAEPPHEQNHYRGNHPGDSKAVQTELGNVGEQHRETHYHKSRLDIELRTHRRLKPAGSAYGIGNQHAHNQCPEGPLQITVESEFGAYKTHHNRQEKYPDERRDEL